MKYTVNPMTVEADRIEGVGEQLGNGGVRVVLEGQGAESDGTVVQKYEMLALPKVGDYLVKHEDGSRNVVPKEPFEATHTVSPGSEPEPRPAAESPE